VQSLILHGTHVTHTQKTQITALTLKSKLHIFLMLINGQRILRLCITQLFDNKKEGSCGILSGDISTGRGVQISPGPLFNSPGPLCIILFSGDQFVEFVGSNAQNAICSPVVDQNFAVNLNVSAAEDHIGYFTVAFIILGRFQDRFF